MKTTTNGGEEFFSVELIVQACQNEHDHLKNMAGHAGAMDDFGASYFKHFLEGFTICRKINEMFPESVLPSKIVKVVKKYALAQTPEYKEYERLKSKFE